MLHCLVLLSATLVVYGIRFDGINQYLNIEKSLYKFVQHPIERQHVVSSLDQSIVEELNPKQSNDKAPHSRRRRSINYPDIEENKKIDTSNFTFAENHNLAFIAWSGKSNSDTIVTLFRDYYVTAGSTSSVWVSHDYGKTYHNLTAKFLNESGASVRLDGFLDSPDDYKDYIFFSLEDKAIFTSQDEAQTFHYHKLAFTPSVLVTHPKNGSILVAYDMTDHQAYVSLDFGEYWNNFSSLLPGESIGGVYWGAEFGQDGVIYVAAEQSNKLFNIYKTDLHLSKKEALFSFSVHEFDIANEYLYAVRVKDSASSSKTLLVSFDGGSFREAEFSSVADDPLARLLERSYYVADGSEGQLVVAVNHHSNLTNLYISESRGIRFSLSLERVLYHDPNLTDVSSSWVYRVRNSKLLDFHKAGGLRGIYVATQLTVGSVGGRYLRTVISYDKGGEWDRISPPNVRYDDTAITCSPPVCYLNLASQFSSIYYSYRTEPILSKNSTPGVIMATGNVGQNLYVYGDLMVSNTAGATWRSALPGFNYYQFGDNGGFMIATLKYYHGAVNYVYYSLDEGMNWQKYNFSQRGLMIWGLLTEPGEYTTEVALYGSTTYYQNNFEWVVVRIDMRGVLGRNCTQSDYNLWSPSDDIPNRDCLLGSRLQYERKKVSVHCYQGLDFMRNVTSQLCPCDRIDYECDFGFDLVENEFCYPSDNLPIVPSNCTPYSSYPRSKGYRKIAGDQCTGEDDAFSPVTTPCPGGNSHFYLDVSAAGLIQDEVLYSVPDNTRVVITAHIHNLSLWNHTFLWSIDNKLIHSNDEHLPYTFTQAKTYLVSLTIFSQVYTASNSTLIRVLNKIDPSLFSIQASDAVTNKATQVSAVLPANTDSYGQLTFNWSWKSGDQSSQASTLSPSHSINFASAGAYQISLTVMNAVSSSSIPSKTIQVYSPSISGFKTQYVTNSLQVEWTQPQIAFAYSYAIIDVSQCPTVDPSHCCSSPQPCCPSSRVLSQEAYQGIVLPSIAGNHTYKLVVVARSSDGSYCTSSSVYQVSTGEGVPGPPSIDDASQGSDGITLNWSPPVLPNGQVTGYQVLSYIGNMPVLNTQSSQFTQRTAQLQNLWPGVMYSFYLQARTAQGYGPSSTRPLNAMSPSTSTLVPIIIEIPESQVASLSNLELEVFMNKLNASISKYNGEIFSPVMVKKYSFAFLFKSNTKQTRSHSDVSAVTAAISQFSYNGISVSKAYKSNFATVENAIAPPSTNAPTTQSVVSNVSSVGFVIAWLVSILFNVIFLVLILSLCISLHRSNKLRKQRYAVLTNFNAEEEEVIVNNPTVQAEEMVAAPTHASKPYSVELQQVATENEDDPMLDVNTSDNTPLLS